MVTTWQTAQQTGRTKSGIERISSLFCVKSPEQETFKALQRIGETSPHLLRDMGFEPDLSVLLPGYDIYRKGKLYVILHIATGDVTLGSEPPRPPA